MRGLAICVLASGCDFLFQLQEIDLPPPPDVPVANDTDGDGKADAADNCPAIANDQVDMDKDGIGDTCDPHPNGPTDVIVSQTLLFDTPADWIALGSWTIEQGRWTSNVVDDISSDISFANAIELSRPSVQIGFTIVERSTLPNNQNVEIDMDSLAPSTEVEGDCDFRYEPTTDMTKIVIHAGGTTVGRPTPAMVVNQRYVGTYTRDTTARCTRDTIVHTAADQVTTFNARPTIGPRYVRVAIDHITLYQVAP